MKRFPHVAAVVSPLYKSTGDDFQDQRERPENCPLLPPTTPKTFDDPNLHTTIKIVESRMYEPVDICRETTNCNCSEICTQTDLDPKEVRNDIPPRKPPRKHKLHRAVRRNSSLERRRHVENRMKNEENSVDVDHVTLETERNYRNKFESIGVQTSHLMPYRLRLLPKLSSGLTEEDPTQTLLKRKLFKIGKIASQWFLSQLGLTIVLCNWAVLGAAAFYHTEGPREEKQAEELNVVQKEIAIDLATALRQVAEFPQVWPQTIERYMGRHKAILLDAVSAGYGEGGGGSIWTYPGCILFSVSLLTTLGFGAPVPRTAMGRGSAVLFASIGIPLHFLLILNVGNLLAGKLQQWYKSSQVNLQSSIYLKVIKWFPLVVVIVYYVMGVALFGFVRQRDAVDCFMFPLDFTAAGGVGKTPGHVRIFYALYLEFAVILAATIVSLLQASATRGVVDFGLRLGLLTNT